MKSYFWLAKDGEVYIRSGVILAAGASEAIKRIWKQLPEGYVVVKLERVE